MIRPKNIVVIGGNAAGCAAAAKAKRFNKDSTVFLFEKSNRISIGTCELPYAISGEIPDINKLIIFEPHAFAVSKGVEVKILHEVISINPRNKVVTVFDITSQTSSDYPYDRLVLATGSVTREDVGFEKDSYSNLFSLKTFQDAEKIIAYQKSERPKRAVVIGSGFVALEVIESLTVLGLEITCIEKQSSAFGFAGGEIGNIIEKIFEEKNISLFKDVNSFKFITEGTKISGVRIGSRTIESDVVFLCNGISPNTILAKKLGISLTTQGAIKVSSKMQTSDSNIYACGDCVAYKEKILGQDIYLPQASLAHSSGHIAGANAAGGNVFLKPVIRNLSVRFLDSFIIRVGLNDDECSSLQHKLFSVNTLHSNLVKVMPNSRPNYIKLVCDKTSGRIYSASLFGGHEVSGFADIISSFIQNNISAVELSQINYNYTPALSNLINPLSILGRKVEQNIQK